MLVADHAAHPNRPAPGVHRHSLRVVLIPWMVAGVRTQYENLRAFDFPPDVIVDTIAIVPYKQGGWIERLPLLKTTHKGTLRSIICALPLLSRPDYDVIWTQSLFPLIPLLSAARLHLKRRPAVMCTMDATATLMDRFHEIYYGTAPAGGAKRRLRDTLLRSLYRRCAVIMPWSAWAAHSLMRDYGVPESRIRVTAPGVDLEAWSVPDRRLAAWSHGEQPFRLLFVGADFARKGGPLLVDIFREHLRETCELHLVTKAVVPEEPGIHVYREFGPNAPGLRQLYADCDALVLPTRADCFSLASIEAMACGLPVVTCPVGGITEIVKHGRTGMLVPPDNGTALLDAIQALVSDRTYAVTMGLAGRKVVEERFDTRQTAAEIFGLMQRVSRRHAGGEP